MKTWPQSCAAMRIGRPYFAPAARVTSASNWSAPALCTDTGQDIRRQDPILSVIVLVPIIGDCDHSSVEVYPAVETLARLNDMKSAMTSDLAPAPTGPAAMLASPPNLTDGERSELSPLSVITSVTTSDTEMPA